MDATFTLAQERLRAVNPAAVQLLELCALLAPDELPLPLLLSGPTLLPEPLAAAIADPLRRGGVAGALYQSGLLSGGVEDTARIHRLVQDVTLARLPESDRHQRTVDAVRLLDGLFPEESWEPAEWPRCTQLLTHAQAVLDRARTLQLRSATLGSLSNAVGNYLWSRGLDIRRARKLHQQALGIYQRLYEGDHPDVAISLSNLAISVRALGDHEGARELYEHASAMRQRLAVQQAAR